MSRASYEIRDGSATLKEVSRSRDDRTSTSVIVLPSLHRLIPATTAGPDTLLHGEDARGP